MEKLPTHIGKEAAGAVGEAADILQGVNVETYGALSKREKVDYILDQVRLMLLKGDRVRAYILSKKVQRKTLLEDDLQDLKVLIRVRVEHPERLIFRLGAMRSGPSLAVASFSSAFSSACARG